VAADILGGQKPIAFTNRVELQKLREAARPHEVKLHGRFAGDPRPGYEQVYYDLAGCGWVWFRNLDAPEQSPASSPQAHLRSGRQAACVGTNAGMGRQERRRTIENDWLYCRYDR
jgi:hypothetical protein